LGIVQYHPNVRPFGNSRETGTIDQSLRDKVRMMQSVCLPPHHTAVVPVEIVGHRGTVLLELSANLVDVLHIEDSLLEADRDGAAIVVVSNTSKTSHLLKKGE